MEKLQKNNQQRENDLIPATKSNENQPSNTKATTQNPVLILTANHYDLNKPKYKIVVDNGKPYEVKAYGDEDLKELLKDKFQESQNEEYSYFDVKVFNDKDEDISEKMISEIMDEVKADD
jgi:predicted house-cleaning noncanonical NTP pyrophosphatase (MazG superfamily)